MIYLCWHRSKQAKTAWRQREGDYISAILVESVKIDGKLKKKTIKHLGSVGEKLLIHAYYRKWFWEKVEKNMGALILPPDVRGNIINSLENKVAKNFEEEIIKGCKKSIQMFKGFKVTGSSKVREMKGENEHKVIPLILALRDEGLSLRAICRELERAGHRRESGRANWHPQIVSNILEREGRALWKTLIYKGKVISRNKSRESIEVQ